MTKTSASLPWEYRKFSELMNSVKSDLSFLDDANLIQDHKYIKVIMKCNEKLGERIHQSKTCILKVKNYTAPLPEDFWKIENILGLDAHSVTTEYLTGIITNNNLIFHGEDEEVIPEKNERVIPVGACYIDDCTNSNITRIDRNYYEYKYNKRVFPLILSSNVEQACVPYSPCGKWQGEAQVDLYNNEFKFSFKEGEVILTYLGAIQDDEGELLYPFHPLLNDYYEYSVKAKILEDAFLNSEADVANKIKFIEEKLSGAYYDAYHFIQTSKANQWSRMRKEYEIKYYHKWYKAFEN